MVGLERMPDYRGARLQKIDCYYKEFNTHNIEYNINTSSAYSTWDLLCMYAEQNFQRNVLDEAGVEQIKYSLYINTT
jgi:predicted MarR family transcription regulator